MAITNHLCDYHEEEKIEKYFVGKPEAFLMDCVQFHLQQHEKKKNALRKHGKYYKGKDYM